MADRVFRLPPLSFRIVAFLLILWGAAGVYAFYAQTTMRAADFAALPESERRFFSALPGWFAWVYGCATWGGLLGAIALFARSRRAVMLLGVSLIAVVVQFGWVFLATDLIAVKGAARTVPFPLVILAVALLQLALARYGVKRGWLR
ncbi:hypothetical protein DMC47_28645 [Nostoc sp. 3335mG]|nr:hypothetical protein DMC47_28645 [Nostoc sp. 3335mG]